MVGLRTRDLLRVGVFLITSVAMTPMAGFVVAAAEQAAVKTTLRRGSTVGVSLPGVIDTPVLQAGYRDEVLLSHFAFAAADEVLIVCGEACYSAWDVSSGRKLYDRTYPDSIYARKSQVSPDGAYVLTVLANHDIVTIDPRTGNILRTYGKIFPSDTFLRTIGFRSPSELLIIYSDKDGCTTEALDLKSGELVELDKYLPDDDLSAPNGCSFSMEHRWRTNRISPDGRYVLAERGIVLDKDGRRNLTWGTRCCRVFEIGTGKVIDTFQGDEFHSIASDPHFSPDGKTILIQGKDKEGCILVAVWDYHNRRETVVFHNTKRGGDATYNALFLPDSRTLRIIYDWEKPPCYLDVGTSEEKHFPFPPRWCQVVLSQDRNHTALITRDGDVEMYAYPTHQRIWRRESLTRRVPCCEPYCESISPNGRHIAIVMQNRNRVVVWNVPRNCPGRTLEVSAPSWVTSSDFSPDGNWLVIGTSKQFTVWNLKTGKQEWVVPEEVDAVRFHPNSRLILTGNDSLTDGELALWDIKEKRLVRRYHEKRESSRADDFFIIGSVCFSPNGTYILAAGDSSKDLPISLWDTNSGRIIDCDVIENRRDQHARINEAAFSPDGKSVFICASYERVSYLALWSLNIADTSSPASGTVKRRHVCNVDPYVANEKIPQWHLGKMSPDGKIIVGTGTPRTSFQLFDARTGKALRSLHGHLSYINSIAWAPNSQWLATASADGAVILWDAAAGKQRRRIYLLNEGKDWLTISPDGTYNGTKQGRALVEPRE